jgi:hypothetical protein
MICQDLQRMPKSQLALYARTPKMGVDGSSDAAYSVHIQMFTYILILNGCFTQLTFDCTH